MRGTEVINDFKTEEAALAAKDKCIRELQAIIKLDPNDFDNQWVDVKGDGSVYTNRLYKLHGLSCRAGGKYNAYFDESIGITSSDGTPGGATCNNLEEAKAACKKHYIENVLPIGGDENARFLKDAIEANGIRFTSPHFIHFDIDKTAHLGHKHVLTFMSKRLIEMLVEGASAEVLDRVQKEAKLTTGQQPLAMIPQPAVLKAQDAEIENADNSGPSHQRHSQTQGILIDTAVPCFVVEKRNDDVGTPWRISLGKYKTEQEAETVARKHLNTIQQLQNPVRPFVKDTSDGSATFHGCHNFELDDHSLHCLDEQGKTIILNGDVLRDGLGAKATSANQKKPKDEQTKKTKKNSQAKNRRTSK